MLNLSNNLPKYPDDGQKLAAFDHVDCFALPSFDESFGMAPVEAVSAGLPCVLTPHVGCADDLANNGLAVLVTPDGKSVSEGIKTALQLAEEEGIEHYIERGRKFVTDQYNAKNIAYQMQDLYHYVLDKYKKKKHN